MPGRELLVEHRNLATDAHDLTDQYLYGRACIGWKSIFVGQHLVGQLFQVGNAGEIGTASCRERVCQYVSISVVAVSLKKQRTHNQVHPRHTTTTNTRTLTVNSA